MPGLPVEFHLNGNYPNPFNAGTSIGYAISSPAEVTVEIFDILGRHIATLIDEKQATGYHQVTWDAGNLPSGVYFYKVRAGDRSETKKMILLK